MKIKQKKIAISVAKGELSKNKAANSLGVHRQHVDRPLFNALVAHLNENKIEY